MATTSRWATAAALMVSTSGCAASQARINDPVEAIQASTEIPEEQLLDIGVQIFDPGIDESQYATLAKKGIFPEVRKSESRFMPFVLKQTMESTGQWGAVRVIPSEAATLDVVVRGEILKSNGKDLVLDVEVRDATGRKWLKKRYKGEADQGAYHEAERAEHRASATAEGKKHPAASDINFEPYQSLYNQIANGRAGGAAEARRGRSPRGSPHQPIALRGRAGSSRVHGLPGIGRQGPLRAGTPPGQRGPDASTHRQHSRA